MRELCLRRRRTSVSDLSWETAPSEATALRVDRFDFNLDQFNIFTHTWSLGVEEQFYAMFPLLFWGSGIGGLIAFETKRFVLIVRLISAVSLFAFISLHYSDQPAAYFLMPARFWELGTGCLLVPLLTVDALRKVTDGGTGAHRVSEEPEGVLVQWLFYQTLVRSAILEELCRLAICRFVQVLVPLALACSCGASIPAESNESPKYSRMPRRMSGREESD
jgi:peptidoglycan/LPS O-acetylase OafA/YrhL